MRQYVSLLFNPSLSACLFWVISFVQKLLGPEFALGLVEVVLACLGWSVRFGLRAIGVASLGLVFVSGGRFLALGRTQLSRELTVLNIL